MSVVPDQSAKEVPVMSDHGSIWQNKNLLPQRFKYHEPHVDCFKTRPTKGRRARVCFLAQAIEQDKFRVDTSSKRQTHVYLEYEKSVWLLLAVPGSDESEDVLVANTFQHVQLHLRRPERSGADTIRSGGKIRANIWWVWVGSQTRRQVIDCCFWGPSRIATS